jgi:CPA2 family monovalent cation:H+ antiporter-2
LESWALLGNIVLLLATAVICGLVARRLKQNAVVGYLVAGMVLGPTGFGLIGNNGQLRDMSELGVSLLLFAIGLEFSYARLKAIGSIATVGGTLQVVLTIAAVTGLFLALGSRVQEALVIAFGVAMSSTAVVLRVLADRTELDSQHGKNSIGILLLQDLAVVPLLIITQTMAQGADGAEAVKALLLKIGLGVLLGLALAALVRYVMPGLLTKVASSGSRELPVVLAVVSSLGAAWAAHSVGLSPVMGAFVAGLLLAESPFAEQIRADITPLSAVFITIFFASIGTITKLPVGMELLLMLPLGLALLLLKAAILGGIVWYLQRSLRTAVATAFTLSQVGEFTFVIADAGYRGGLVSLPHFQTLLGVSVASLMLTPYLIAWAPTAATLLLRRMKHAERKMLERVVDRRRQDERVIIIGFGPAGEEIVAVLQEAGIPFLVVDLNSARVDAYRSNLAIEFGDATQTEVLHHVGISHARAVISTVPDPAIARLVVAQVHRYAPGVPVIARSRYQRFAQDLREAGADFVVEEEREVGRHLGQAVLTAIHCSKDEPSESAKA